VPYDIRLADDIDADAIAHVFNFYVKTSFAAFPSQVVDEAFYHRLRTLAGKFPMHVIASPEGTVVGFALLRSFHIADTLRRTAEATIFILPEHTRQGIGSRILGLLESDARSHGIDTILGCASSQNGASLGFQRKHGFAECGRFKRVGRKFDQDYDLVWMQKFLDH
jgi:L-amino acid N-acyltransferase YncA